MSGTHATPTRRWLRLASVGVALAALTGATAVGFASSTSADGALAMGTAPAVPQPVFSGAALTPSSSAPLAVAPRPVRVRIPALNIDAALDPLHLDAEGVLVPPDYGRAGWYEAGPEPGERGRAVIAGHVDSATGLDIFSTLGRAEAGDRVQIRTSDGSTLTFVVDSVGVYPRSAFPTERVYAGPKRRAEIRLITCGGRYDRAEGGYQDNVVVFGHLVRHRR